MRRPATARVHLPGPVAYVWGKRRRPRPGETAGGGGERGAGRNASSACSPTQPSQAGGPGSASRPALPLDRGRERLGGLPKFTWLWLPVAVSLLCHPLRPQAEGSWLLLGAPVMGRGALSPWGRGLHRNPREQRRRAVQPPGKAGRGRVWGSGGREGPRGACGQGARGAWFWPGQGGPHLLGLSREGQTRRGGRRATKQQPRVKRTGLLTPHLVP